MRGQAAEVNECDERSRPVAKGLGRDSGRAADPGCAQPVGRGSVGAVAVTGVRMLPDDVGCSPSAACHGDFWRSHRGRSWTVSGRGFFLDKPTGLVPDPTGWVYPILETDAGDWSQLRPAYSLIGTRIGRLNSESGVIETTGFLAKLVGSAPELSSLRVSVSRPVAARPSRRRARIS